MSLRQEQEAESGSLKLVVEVKEVNTSAVLQCAGRICFRQEADLFSRKAQQVLERGLDVVLDMARVTAVDSAGIGQLVLIHMQARAAQCEVRIAAAPPAVVQLLQLTNVASLFEMYPAVQDALASLSRELA